MDQPPTQVDECKPKGFCRDLSLAVARFKGRGLQRQQQRDLCVSRVTPQAYRSTNAPGPRGGVQHKMASFLRGNTRP